MNIQIGASQISGFQPNGIGVDVALTGMSVTLSSPSVTGTNFLPQSVVGLGGFKITFSTGVTYTVATVTSRSALTLATNYGESSGPVTGTLHKLVHLRIYVLTPFVPFGESFVAQSGAPGSTAWFRRYGVSIISDGTQNVAHVPEIVLPATTDSSVPTARYFGGLYTQSGAFIQAYPGCVDQWQLDHQITPTSWPQICDFNIASPPTPNLTPDNFVTEQELNARLPNGVTNQLLYFKNTGNVLSPLTLDAAFTITADTLFLAGPSGVNRIQEEGANLPQRQILNFVGSAFAAADDIPNLRTNVTADADLNALASNVTNGFWAAGTNIARVLTGTANEIGITNGNGTVGNPIFSLPTTLTFTGKTITGGTFSSPAINTPTITGGTFSSPTITTPRIVTAILDANGNEIIRTPATGSAVNDITVANAAAGSGPTISATGDDTNIPLTDATKGTGNRIIQTNGIPRVTVAGADANAYFGDGVTSATPDNYVINATGGNGTNIAGAHLDLAGGKGTGNAVPGQVAARYVLIGASGTTPQSLSADRFPFSTSLYSNTTIGTVIANTITETSLFTGAAASGGSTLTVQGGLSRAGTVYRMRFYLVYTTTGTPTIQFKLKLGSVIVANSGAFTTLTTINGLAYIDMFIFINALGAAGLVRGQMEGRLTSSLTGAVTNVFFSGAAGEVVVDTTANQVIDFTGQWGTASASNTVQLLSAYIDRDR